MRKWSLSALVGAAFLFCSGPLLAAGAESGKALYRKYCASCHGLHGEGNGPEADLLSAPPRNLREGFIENYSTEELTRRILEGRPLTLALDPAALGRRASEVEAIVLHLERLPRVDWAKVGPGWDLYADRCQECHGSFGRPSETLPEGVRKPRNLADPVFQEGVRDEDLAAVVRHGRHGMPALTPRIGESEAISLAAFVRFLSPGMELYTRYCAACHGDEGLGVRSPPGSVGMPNVRFDAEYFSRRDQEQLRKRVWHMLQDEKARMPHFRWDISEPQARAIVEYLKTRP